MVKPSRSRTSLFSQWRFDSASADNKKELDDHHRSPSTSSNLYSPRDHHTFSPSTTSSTPFASPSSYLSSDPFRYSLALPAPYTTSSSSPYYKEAIGSGTHESPYGGIAEDDTDDDHHHQNPKNLHSRITRTDPSSNHHQNSIRYHPNPDAVKSTESLVSGTATTPKITLASPSTSTIHHYLFPDPGEKVASNLDPSAARKIARGNSKRQVLSSKDEREKVAEEDERRKLELAFPEPPKGRPLRPTRRIVSPSSPNPHSKEDQETGSATTTSTSGPAARKDEKHPLSMRTLRRQPSMADLGTQNKRVALGDPIELQSETRGGRTVSEKKGNGQSRQVSDGWKGTLRRRESEAWRELVGSSDRDQSPAMSPDLVSPMTTSFPSNIHDFNAPHPSIRARHVTPATCRTRPDAMFDHPQAGLPSHSPSVGYTSSASPMTRDRPVVSPIYPTPYISDEPQLSQSPVYSYNQLDFSISTASASGMSRCGTLGSTRLDSIPMERDVPRSGMGSYDSGKLAARADALRRLSGFPGIQTPGQSADREGSFTTLRRTVSFKKESAKKEKRSTGGNRPRAYSLSAKMAREIGISSPLPNPMPMPSLNRESLHPSRGIYLGDLSVDLGGRYGDRFSTSPTSSGGTSLYPPSSTSSYFPRQSTSAGRPLHPALSSEISLLAPSSIGLGFSPVGTPVSLPESLQAEAIDLTGNYGPGPERGTTTATSSRFNRPPKRTSSLHCLKLGGLQEAPPPVPDLPTTGLNVASPDTNPTASEAGQMEGKELPPKDKPRRSFLLAQNTFYIPPLVAPPSLRSSRSLSNLHPSQPSTPTSAIPPTPPIPNQAYTKRSHTRRGTGAFGICSPNGEGIDPLPLSPSDHTSPLSLSSVPPSIRLERKRSSPFLSASASIRMMFTQNSIARSLSKSFDRDRESRANTSMDTQQSTSATLKSKISGPVENDGERIWREGLLREAVTASLGGSVSRPESSGERRGTNPKSRLAIPRQFLQAPVDIDETHLEVEIDTAMSLLEDREERNDRQREKRGSKQVAMAMAEELTNSEYPWATLADSTAKAVDDGCSLYSRHSPPRPRSRSASVSTTSHKRKSRPPTPSFPRLGSPERAPETVLPPLPVGGNLSRLHQSSPRHLAGHATAMGRSSKTELERFQSGVTVRRKPTPYYRRERHPTSGGTGIRDEHDSDDDTEEDEGEEGSLDEEIIPHSYLEELQTSFDRIQAELDSFEAPSPPPIPTTSTTTESRCLARSVRSLSTSLRPRLSKPKLNLPEPVSSTTPVPIVRILSALSAREAGQRRAGAHGPVDKERKIHEWRTEVEENGDLARLEERIIKHVEREKETLRDLGRREGSPSSLGTH